MKSFLISSVMFVLFCVACGAGTTGNQSISVQNVQSCGSGSGAMTESSCTITLAYSTGGTSGLSIGFNLQGGGSGQYSINTGSCNPPINNTYTQTCPVSVTYSGTPLGTPLTLSFTLGSVTSGSVTVKNTGN